MARAGMPGTRLGQLLQHASPRRASWPSRGYFLFGGFKLLRRGGRRTRTPCRRAARPEPFTARATADPGRDRRAHPGRAGAGRGRRDGRLRGAAVLSLARAADEEQAIQSMPWGVILMVSGVTVLVEVLAKTGGLELFTQSPGAALRADLRHRRDRARHRRHLGLQQLVRRGAADVPAARCPGLVEKLARRQPADDRLLDQRRLPPRGRLAALDARRLVPRRWPRRRRTAPRSSAS